MTSAPQRYSFLIGSNGAATYAAADADPVKSGLIKSDLRTIEEQSRKNKINTILTTGECGLGGGDGVDRVGTPSNQTITAGWTRVRMSSGRYPPCRS